MIGPNCRRAMSLCLLATVFLVACTGRQQFWASPTVREIEEVKGRTVPSDGSLLRESGPGPRCVQYPCQLGDSDEIGQSSVLSMAQESTRPGVPRNVGNCLCHDAREAD